MGFTLDIVPSHPLDLIYIVNQKLPVTVSPKLGRWAFIVTGNIFVLRSVAP